MGARPTQFRKSGGFLNGVDGVIKDYQFTDEFNGEPFKPGKKPGTKEDKFHSLYCVLTVLVDGADDTITTTFFVGGADDWDVSADGHTLTPAEGMRSDQQLGAGVSFTKFISSLCENGFDESRLPEDETDFSAIIGERVRFVQREDESMKGKLRKDKNTGKEYKYTNTLVDRVYSRPEEEEKGTKKVAKAGSKVNGKAAEEEDEVDIAELAGRAIREILKKAGKPILKAKLSTLALTTPLLRSHPNREDVRKWVFKDDNLDQLASDDVISYDRDTQTISAAA